MVDPTRIYMKLADPVLDKLADAIDTPLPLTPYVCRSAGAVAVLC